MLKPYQSIGSEDFELALHNVVALIDRDNVGSVVFDCKFLQPTHTTAPSYQCYLYVLRQDCPDDAIAAKESIDLGAINWVAVECLQRWGYWDRARFESEWMTEELHDRRIHRQHYIYTARGAGYAISLVSEGIPDRAPSLTIAQSCHPIARKSPPEIALCGL